jgi:hypothetical protein
MTAQYFVGGSMDLTKRRVPGGEREPPEQEVHVPVCEPGGLFAHERYCLAYAQVVGEGSLAVYVYAGTRT